MEEIKKRAAKLIDVKSLVTLMVALVFCIMALCGVIGEQAFLTIFTVIISFYFGTQTGKKADSAEVKYVGPQQGEAVPEQPTVQAKATVDEAVQNDVHPPDFVVEGFGATVSER